MNEVCPGSRLRRAELRGVQSYDRHNHLAGRLSYQDLRGLSLTLNLQAFIDIMGSGIGRDRWPHGDGDTGHGGIMAVRRMGGVGCESALFE
jgi:hypothetical protein